MIGGLVVKFVAIFHLLSDLYLMDMFALRIIKMDRARETRVERMDRANYLERLAILCDRRSDQRFFVRRTLAFSVTRTRVPCAWDDQLIVVDLLVLNADPMRQPAA